MQETVSSQWYVGKYEPPAQNLPNGTSMRPIDNPVADAVNAFRAAWRMPEAREQLMDFMLSLDGLRSSWSPAFAKTATSPRSSACCATACRIWRRSA